MSEEKKPASPWQIIVDVTSELIRGGQTADIRCRAALGVLERAGVDFDGDPVAKAVREPQPAPAGTALLADLRDRMGVGEPVDRPGDQWGPQAAPEPAADQLAALRHNLAALAGRLSLEADLIAPSKTAEVKRGIAGQIRDAIGGQA